MHAAVVLGPGRDPVYAEFPDPVANPGEQVVAVTAAALSPLARARAAGAHYSANHGFPFVAGVDGVGRLADGRRVYVGLARAPYGTIAERTVAPDARCLPLPDDLDDLAAAAIANPGASSWVSLTERARLRPGETVLVNGATGAAGRLAVQIARHLGAGRVVATGRNRAALAEVAALGADATIPLVEDDAAMAAAFEPLFAAGVDVVLDYLWGRSALQLLTAAGRTRGYGAPVRFVQVGSVSGPEIMLPSAVLRSAPIELLGSGLGTIPLDRHFARTAEMLQAAGPAGLRVATRVVPLASVAEGWAHPVPDLRTVFTVDRPSA